MTADLEKPIENGWSRNVLVLPIESSLYQRQGKAVTNFVQTFPAPQRDLAQQLLKDHYNVDFLSLGREFDERDLKRGLLENPRDFLLELGVGFAFADNQYRLEAGGRDFYLCLQNQKKSALQLIRIPEGLTLDVQDRKDAEGMEKTEVILRSRYGNLTFAIAPYSQRVSARSREGLILYKYCGVAEQTELWLAKFYISVVADFGGLRIFSLIFREDFLPWVEGLFECLKNELDWQKCQEGDIERMLVSIATQIETLPQGSAS